MGIFNIFGNSEKDNNTEDTGAFKMIIEDTFGMGSRGTVATGTVEYGTITNGQKVNIKNIATGVVNKAKVSGIKLSKKLVTEAKQGDTIALMMSGIKTEDISKGDEIYI